MQVIGCARLWLALAALRSGALRGAAAPASAARAVQVCERRARAPHGPPSCPSRRGLRVDFELQLVQAGSHTLSLSPLHPDPRLHNRRSAAASAARSQPPPHRRQQPHLSLCLPARCASPRSPATMPREGAEQTINVPSDDPARKPDKEGEQNKGGEGAANGDKQAAAEKKQAKKEDELSEEDVQLKNELEMLVERLKVSRCPDRDCAGMPGLCCVATSAPLHLASPPCRPAIASSSCRRRRVLLLTPAAPCRRTTSHCTAQHSSRCARSSAPARRA